SASPLFGASSSVRGRHKTPPLAMSTNSKNARRIADTEINVDCDETRRQGWRPCIREKANGLTIDRSPSRSLICSLRTDFEQPNDRSFGKQIPDRRKTSDVTVVV